MAAQRPMDGEFAAADAQLAVRTQLVRGRGGMVRAERGSGGDGDIVVVSERGLRRVVQAEHRKAGDRLRRSGRRARSSSGAARRNPADALLMRSRWSL